MPHTPGPWSVYHQSWNEKISVVDSNGVAICVIPTVWCRGDSQEESNANLIAAAPRMYEALLVAIHYVEKGTGVYNTIAAAIAAAEGKEGG